MDKTLERGVSFRAWFVWLMYLFPKNYLWLTYMQSLVYLNKYIYNYKIKVGVR